jgi:hypothetical protein
MQFSSTSQRKTEIMIMNLYKDFSKLLCYLLLYDVILFLTVFPKHLNTATFSATLWLALYYDIFLPSGNTGVQHTQFTSPLLVHQTCCHHLMWFLLLHILFVFLSNRLTTETRKRSAHHPSLSLCNFHPVNWL